MASSGALESISRRIAVAVVGSGYAGLAAAIEAACNMSEKIVVVEKMNEPGGNSVMNAGKALPSILFATASLRSSATTS